MGYWKLLIKNPRSIGFGFLNAFFSGLGQTHFIALLGPLVMSQYALSNTEYGSLYSLITLVSGIFIGFIGPMIDRHDARILGAALGVGLLISQLLVSLTDSLYGVVLGLFGLRLFGQGLCSSLSSITVARFFDQQRGKALSLSQLGFPVFEGVITPLGAVIIAQWNYNTLSWILCVSLILVFIPLCLFLTAPLRDFNQVAIVSETTESHPISTNDWNRKKVFSHITAYLVIPHALMPPFALTGVFFHQAIIGELKGWSLSLMASGLFFFAVGRIVNSFITGPMVDQHTAIKLFPWYQLPLAFGFLILGFFNGPWAPALAFSLFGLSVGSGGPIKSAIWAELYGIKHLGAIKSLFATFMVFSTAASPALFGWIIDQTQSTQGLLTGLFVSSLMASFLAYWGLNKHPRRISLR